MTDTSEHALLNASAAVGWSTCGVYLRMNAGAPATTSRASQKGTVQHTVAAWCLENDAMPDQYPDPAVEVNGVQWPITQEMRNAIADYLKVVRKRAEGGTLLVEQRVDYSWWILGPTPPDVYILKDGKKTKVTWLAGGTSDTVILFDEVLDIIDAKFGENPNNKVFAYETIVSESGKETVVPNPQLALYALGCLYEYEHLGTFKKVRLTIVQPYLDHVSTCEVDVTDLKTFALRMKAAAFTAIRHLESEHEPPLDAYKPSDKACQWCKRAHSCPALKADVEVEERDLFGALMTEGGEALAAAIPEDRLAQAMSKVDLIETFTKAIRAEVERRLLAGHPVPGFKLVEGRAGPRSWADEEKALKDLRRHLGAKDAVVLKPISPTQVENQFVKKGLMSSKVWKNLGANVERSDGKPSVAPESDKRPAIGVTSVDDRFAQIGATEELRSQLEASVAELKASPTGCEEASLNSKEHYIPCNAPARFMVKNRDATPYRMCEMCADHNVKNRGAVVIGDFVIESAEDLV